MNQMDLNMTADSDIEAPKATGPLRWVRRFVVVAAPLLVIILGYVGCTTLLATGPQAEDKQEAPHPVAVQVSPASARAVTITVTAQGEARPRVQSSLAAQVTGRIVWVSPNYIEGGSFRAGETIVRIDPANYRLAVVRARAQVAQAQEALQREQAEGELARQDWEQLGQGEPSDLVLRSPQLAQAQAALDAAGAQLSSAELDLARTNISAPFGGRVRQRRVNPGDYVAPGAPVADVFATDVMEVRVPLTDSDLAALNARFGDARGANAAPAHLTAAVGGQLRTWEGRLARIEATVDSTTRLTYGIIEVRDPFGRSQVTPLAPGIFVTARIEGAREQQLVCAPRSALKRNEFIYVVNADNTVDVRSVRAATTTAEEVCFRDALRDGERVVLSHLPSPRDGMAVTPIARAQPAQAAAPAAETQTPAAPAQQEPLELRR